MTIPSLVTERLILNPFTSADGEAVEKLAGNITVSRMTFQVPHPYPKNSSQVWMDSHAVEFSAGRGVTFALRMSRTILLGCVSLRIDEDGQGAELGYWIGEE